MNANRLIYKRLSAALIFLVAGFLVSSTCIATVVDADAAQTIARQSGCFKCHSVERKKDGPAFRDVAAKFRGKPDAVSKLVVHITTGPRVEFPNGLVEDHKIIKTTDQDEINNLVRWILSL